MVDTETGKDKGKNQSGELLVRSLAIMKGMAPMFDINVFIFVGFATLVLIGWIIKLSFSH